MECKRAVTLLEAYLDNELDRTEARELESHVDGCAECRAALTRLGELRAALRDRALRHEAPAALRERIASAVAGEARTAGTPAVTAARRARPPLSSWLRIAAACVLAFAAGGASVYMWNRGPGDADSARVTNDLFAAHWRSLAAASPVDVISSDRHTVKPWFAGKLAVAPLVLDFAEQGFALAGGRIDYVGTQRVPVLVYRHGQHLIDVFVLPTANAAVEPARQQGYTLSPVTLGSQPAAIVSDMDPQELARFAQMVGSAK